MINLGKLAGVALVAGLSAFASAGAVVAFAPQPLNAARVETIGFSPDHARAAAAVNNSLAGSRGVR